MTLLVLKQVLNQSFHPVVRKEDLAARRPTAASPASPDGMMLALMAHHTFVGVGRVP